MLETVAGFQLSPQQERLWLLQERDEGTNAYRAQCVVMLQGDLQTQLLEEAISNVVEQHEILRTCFRSQPGMFLPLQVITDATPTLHRVDLTELTREEQQVRVEKLIADAGRKTFGPSSDPLLDFTLITLTPVEHLLLITLPSACADHESLRQIVREVKCAYAKEARVDEPVQYKVVSQWFNDVLEAEEAQIGKDDWHEQRSSETTAAKLPFQRDALAAFEWRSIGSCLPRELVRRLDQLIAQLQTTHSAFFLTCWQALLHRLTGETSVTVGTCFDGRSDADLTEALGLFARYLPIPSHIEENSRFAEVLTKTDQAVRQAYDWQECFAWEQVDASFPFCFEYDEQPTAYSAGDITFSITRQHACIDRFGLKLACSRREDSLTTDFYFDPAIFEQEDIERVAEEFQTLLESVIEDPRAAIRELTILGDAEHYKVLVELNDTRSDYPRESCLHELFEQQVAHTPENVALVFRDDQMTFAELNARSNQLARHLRTLGVSEESLVAICMERSLEMVVALLATLKAGAAYVPLDPESPAERQARILQDILECADLSALWPKRCQGTALQGVVLTQQGLRANFQEFEAIVICVETDRENFAGYSEENLPRYATANNLAYVIFTSGSTGTPKGVMISHRAICNHMIWLAEHFGLDEHDTILQKTPFFFDASVSEFFAPLLTGGRLVLAEPGGQRDPAYIVDIMARAAVTTLQVVPSMLRALVEEPGLAHVSTLKRVICAGEALPVDLRDKFQSSLSARLYNLYGPTETAIDATSWDCELPVQQKTVPIGGPIANTRVYVLDSVINPVPFGVAGELYLGGDGLARGYLKRPELTAERFIPDPFSAEPGARLYTTGDLVRYLPEKALEFLSRSDEQVKIRGFRIEPGEIETLLNRHLLVRQAVVTAEEDEQGNKRLVAYVVQKNVSRLPNGLQVAQLNENETTVLYDEIFVQRTYLKHGVTLADGDCVFDVGANVGLFTLFVHQQCPNPKVYSFEPVPATFEVLKTNVALYKLNAEIFNCGLSRRNGTTKGTFYPQMSSMSGLYADRIEDEQVSRAFLSNQDARLHRYADELLEGRFRSETFDCALTTISDVICQQQVETIDLLKVDAEKSELDILNGIREEDWNKIRQIVLEVHDVGGRLEEIVNILKRRAFSFVVEQDASQTNTQLYNIYAIHPSRTRKNKSHSDLSAQLQSISNSFGVSNSELRTYLEERLPAYMVPSAFIKLDAIPLLPSGKINRKALPAPDWTRAETNEPYVAPRTSVEKRLAEIWMRTLGLEQVSIYDSFFALGGDSILGIQLIAKANQAGLRLTIKELFQHKTIAALSQVVGANAIESVEAEPSGLTPPTPAQQWFFEQQLADQHHYNQSVLVEVEAAEARVFAEIFKHLLRHHDALQLRFICENGDWQQVSGGDRDDVPFDYEDLSHCSVAEQQTRIESRAVALQASLNLQDGPLMRVVVFNRGMGRSSVLLMVIHHLVVDGISWRILTEDFETAYRQLLDGRPVQLPPKTTSFSTWSRRLVQYAQSQEVQNERAYWLDEARAQAPALPVDFVSGANTVASTNTISVSLNSEETAALLHDVPRAYNTQINDVLLTALVLAFSNWTSSTTLLVDIEGHGRETIDNKTDISRTVGWFTSLFPVLFEAPDADEPGEALKSIKEQLRRVPNRGFGYGLLRYLSTDQEVRATLSSLPQAEVSFNYLGQFDRSDTNNSIVGATLETSAPIRSPHSLRRHLLEINGSVRDGQLRLSWIYSANRHRRESIELLANDFIETLQSLIAHCINLEARGYTPSDFPEADLDQAELDDLIASLSGSISIQEPV
ncbi:MAG TPA: amino acid adenylation domain-containing protein [Pyrinomonadaceae bacterium]|nr:amino acid adenylation domain-containing protein [Pyrinomonadaceae bacterium]